MCHGINLSQSLSTDDVTPGRLILPTDQTDWIPISFGAFIWLKQVLQSCCTVTFYFQQLSAKGLQTNSSEPGHDMETRLHSLGLMWLSTG